MESQAFADWTEEEIEYLKDNYLITSFVEFAKTLGKHPDDVAAMAVRQKLRATEMLREDPRMAIHQLLREHKRFLPNGWLLGLDMSRSMNSRLVRQIEENFTWLEEIEEEIGMLLDSIVQLYEITPLLDTGDLITGADHGQQYRVTGRAFTPASKWITYYFAYVYGSVHDLPEAYGYDEFEDEDDEDGDESDDGFEIRIHNN